MYGAGDAAKPLMQLVFRVDVRAFVAPLFAGVAGFRAGGDSTVSRTQPRVAIGWGAWCCTRLLKGERPGVGRADVIRHQQIGTRVRQVDGIGRLVPREGEVEETAVVDINAIR
jgi:hypothetical protein